MEQSPWTAGELLALRAARYRPSAWQAFLGRSFARAAEARVERPQAHRQVQLLAAAGLAAALALALGWSSPAGVALAAWWVVTILMLDWHLALLDDGAGRRLQALGPANLLSIGRYGLAPVLLFLPAAGVVAALGAAAASDVFDGALARRRQETSRLGVWLDRTSDSLVAAAATVAAYRLERLGVVAAALALARALVPWAAALGLSFARARVAAGPLPLGRVTGLALGASLAAALLGVPAADVLVSAAALAGLALSLLPNRIRDRPHQTRDEPAHRPRARADRRGMRGRRGARGAVARR